MEMRERNVVVQVRFELRRSGDRHVAGDFQFGDRITEKEVTAGLIRRPGTDTPSLYVAKVSRCRYEAYVNSRGYMASVMAILR
jgi:hypothetical protein